jgi:hypothetical protein
MLVRAKHLAASLAAAAMLLSCGSQTALDPDSGLLEMERVWQYMKVFSLYQDRLPDHADALQLDSPQQLVETLHDTLLTSGDTTLDIASYAAGCSRGTQFAQSGKASGAADEQTVYYKRMTDSTAYLAITSFKSQTPQQLRAYQENVDSVANCIIDLRGNPGGDLEACTAGIELFLPKNTGYIRTKYRRSIYEEADTGTVETIWTARRDNRAWEQKQIAVLVNYGTASAAEIMASGLRHGLGGRVVIVGDTTFGKAIGQYVFCFSTTSGAELSLTGFRFYALDGPDYHERGIAPDVIETREAGMVARAGELLEAGFTERYAQLPEFPVLSSLAEDRAGSGRCAVYVETGGDLLF